MISINHALHQVASQHTVVDYFPIKLASVLLLTYLLKCSFYSIIPSVFKGKPGNPGIPGVPGLKGSRVSSHFSFCCISMFEFTELR